MPSNYYQKGIVVIKTSLGDKTDADHFFSDPILALFQKNAIHAGLLDHPIYGGPFCYTPEQLALDLPF